MNTSAKILLIDDKWGRPDDPIWMDRFGQLPYRVCRETAARGPRSYSAAVAMACVERELPDLGAVLLDVSFGDNDKLGLEILEGIRSKHPQLPIVIFTHFETATNRELLVRSLELGANDYLEKSSMPDHLDETLRLYIDPARNDTLLGNSDGIRRLRAQIARVSFSGETPVLVIGESGTGKDLVAHAVHRHGPRRRGNFVVLDNATEDSDAIESELFGHEAGAFVGATERRIGAIERAHLGVLFLDEIADMSLVLQGKLLRVLETRTFRRLGGNEQITSQFQLVCATNRQPEELLRSGRLREDFYHRVGTILLHVPPLRKRSADVGLLAEWMVRKDAAVTGHSARASVLTGPERRLLEGHDWPGNVRELRNVMHRACILGGGSTLDVRAALVAAVSGASTPAAQIGPRPDLPEEHSWVIARIRSELELAVATKERVKVYKGQRWRSEFMRLLYPQSRVPSSRGIEDVIKRLTQGPWGFNRWRKHQELVELVARLRE